MVHVILTFLAGLTSVSVLAGFLTACGGETPEAEIESAAEAPPEIPARTADPFQRGLTEADFPRVQELAPGVWSYEQLRSAGEELFTTVSMFVITDEGVLVADGQGSYEETALLVEEIGKLTDQPITHVVVASDHGDHTAGNAAFPEGVEFIVHRNSVAPMEALAERIPDLPVPQTVVFDRLDLSLGGRAIEILFLGRAHTGGDLVVHLPEESVLFLSEAFLHRVFPAMRSAYPAEWGAMLRKAQELGARINIPGHGFVDSPEVLADELEEAVSAIVHVIVQVSLLYHAGLDEEQAVAQADFGRYESWSLSTSQRETAIRRVWMELNGELPETPMPSP